MGSTHRGILANLREHQQNAYRLALAAIYGHQGRIDEAQSVWAEMIAISPDYSFAEKRKILPYKNPEDLDHIAEGLRKAGIHIPE